MSDIFPLCAWEHIQDCSIFKNCKGKLIFEIQMFKNHSDKHILFHLLMDIEHIILDIQTLDQGYS